MFKYVGSGLDIWGSTDDRWGKQVLEWRQQTVKDSVERPGPNLEFSR